MFRNFLLFPRKRGANLPLITVQSTRGHSRVTSRCEGGHVLYKMPLLRVTKSRRRGVELLDNVMSRFKNLKIRHLRRCAVTILVKVKFMRNVLVVLPSHSLTEENVRKEP